MPKAEGQRTSEPGASPVLLGPSRGLLSVGAAAELLDVAPLTVRRLIERGDLGSLKVGRVVRIPLAEVERFVTERLTRRPGAWRADT